MQQSNLNLLFFARALLASKDAGIHGLDIFYEQCKELITVAEDKLLAYAKGLCSKKLDKLNRHFIRVVWVAVNTLLLEEVDL